MFNYCASDHTFILGCRPKERRERKKKKARDLQLKSYKAVNFTLEQNHLQWQISKAICMRFSWKADDPKFLCLTGSDLPNRTGGFSFAAPPPLQLPPRLLCCYQFTSLCRTRIRILEMLVNADRYSTPSIFKDVSSDMTSLMESAESILIK